MRDLIERQAAIDAVKSRKTAEQSSAGIMRNAVVDFCVDIIKKLPSAQPEIIRCVDCVHSDTFRKGADNDMPLKCLGIRYGGVMPDWYCEHAERRTDGSD